MIELKGKSVFGGIGIGPATIFTKNNNVVKRKRVQDRNHELERLNHALESTKSQLQLLYEKALKEVGKENAGIFEVHEMILEDMDYLDSIRHIITSEQVNAEFAVATTGDNFSRMFSAMEDEYFRGRAIDVLDVSNRLVSVLSGKNMDKLHMEQPVVVFADDLTPSETVQLDKEKVLAFVTKYGSVNSHTAILARTMNIPAIISLNYPDDLEGKQVIVDGYKGQVYIDPDEPTLLRYINQQEQEMEKRRLLQTLKGLSTETKDGKKVMLYANIGGVGDVADVLNNDAEGIGLFRSEFLYLGRTTLPSEEEQFLAYKTVASNMSGRRVIIRTLDIGADKQSECLPLDCEENPALGYRAIRICLTQTDIFRTQLRAILRASYYGKIAIMFPMIISRNELVRIKEILKQVEEELDQQDIPYDKDLEIGVMIETPAAVMISEQLAEEVDFFSIGTNDLTQYSLAIDRQNEKLDDFYDPYHESVMRMIQIVINSGHEKGIWVGICGELASDLEVTERLIQMGIDELSVSASFILPIRERIRKTNLSQ